MASIEQCGRLACMSEEWNISSFYIQSCLSINWSFGARQNAYNINIIVINYFWFCKFKIDTLTINKKKQKNNPQTTRDTEIINK